MPGRGLGRPGRSLEESISPILISFLEPLKCLETATPAR
jgi:hypothetical protein